ncbi:MAG: hypothetical protein ACR2OB_08080 [Solirubrobacteraceae bacterium]
MSRLGSKKYLVVVGAWLVGISWLSLLVFAAFYILDPMRGSFLGSGLGWRGLWWIAAVGHVAGWGLMWLGASEANFGLRSSRAVLGCAGVLAIVGTGLLLVGLGQYGQWHEYRFASRCAVTAGAVSPASAACISEQAAVIESIQVDTSTPSQYNAPAPGQKLEIRLADHRKRTVSVLRPPWVTYEHCERGLFSDVLAEHGFATCEAPVKASLYRGRVVRLTLPSGERTDTDMQPGGYRLVAWLGALCLLGALWPLLALGLSLRRVGSGSASRPMVGESS